MLEEFDMKVEKVKKEREGFKLIRPLKDFRITCNEHDIIIKKDEEIEIPLIFIPNLKTEKVIN